MWWTRWQGANYAEWTSGERNDWRQRAGAKGGGADHGLYTMSNDWRQRQEQRAPADSAAGIGIGRPPPLPKPAATLPIGSRAETQRRLGLTLPHWLTNPAGVVNQTLFPMGYGDGCPSSSPPPTLPFPPMAGMGIVVPAAAVSISNGSRFAMTAEPNGLLRPAHEADNESAMDFYLQQQMNLQWASILQMAAQRTATQQLLQQQQQQIMSLQMQVDNQVVDCEPTTHALYANTQHTYTMHFNL